MLSHCMFLQNFFTLDSMDFTSSVQIYQINVLQLKLLYQHILSILLDSTFTLSDFKMASFIAILQECEAFRGGIPSRQEPYEIITRYLIKLMFKILCKFSHVSPDNMLLPTWQSFIGSKLSTAAFDVFFKGHNITPFSKVSQF